MWSSLSQAVFDVKAIPPTMADCFEPAECGECYVCLMVAVFREVWRVCRDDATVWINLGDSYNAAGRDGHGTRIGYKQGTNRASANGDDANRPTAPGLKPKDLVGIPWRLAFALQADGWWLRSEIIWAKKNPFPESVTDRPTKSHEQIFLLTKSAKYYYDADAVREQSIGENEHDVTGQGYEAPGQTPHSGNRMKRRTVRPGIDTKGGGQGTGEMSYPAYSRNLRSVWSIATQPFSGAHFAVFPEEIPKRCILAGSKAGDVILDPFAGSGTTIAVAESLGRRGIGLELKPEYIALAKKRCQVTIGFPF